MGRPNRGEGENRRENGRRKKKWSDGLDLGAVWATPEREEERKKGKRKEEKREGDARAGPLGLTIGLVGVGHWVVFLLFSLFLDP